MHGSEPSIYLVCGMMCAFHGVIWDLEKRRPAWQTLKNAHSSLDKITNSGGQQLPSSEMTKDEDSVSQIGERRFPDLLKNGVLELVKLWVWRQKGCKKTKKKPMELGAI